MSGLFDTFTVAKRGLNVHQSAINTTSHNIANANTEGYSRQRSVIETTRPFGGMSRFDASGPGQVGTGAEVTTIQRIRDYFIDYQVRNENGKLGNYDVRSNFLTQVEDVFGEPSDKAMQKLFSQFFASYQELAKTPEKSASRTVALEKTIALTDTINHTYTQLEKMVTDAQGLLQSNVNDLNGYLDDINELNKQITSVCAVGQTPNDLMDSRDVLLDKVSRMLGMTVERKDKEAINLKAEGFQSADNTIENLVNADPNATCARFSYVKGVKDPVEDPAGSGHYKVSFDYYPLGNSNAAPKTIEITKLNILSANSLKDSLEQNRILIADKDGNAVLKGSSTVSGKTYDVEKINGVITSVVDKSTNPPTTLTKTGVNWETTSVPPTIVADSDIRDSLNVDLNKSIFQIYKLDPAVNSVDPKNIKGEIAGNQSVQNMVLGYMKDLDKIAASLAYSVNAIVTGNTIAGANSLADNKSYEMLFVNSDTPTTDAGISAKTITVNKNIIDDTSKLNCKAKDTDGERNGDRAQAIADLISTKMNISNIDLDGAISVKELIREDFFGSTFAGVSLDSTTHVKIKGNTDGKTVDGYYKDIISELGTKTQEANRITENERDVILKDLENQRLSVSGVSLDEEMTNLIQYQHAYQASAKVISTVDELLDVVINGLKR